jgi:hypothetical protein
MHTTKTCVRRNVERKILVLFRTTVLGVLWRLAGGVSTAKSLYPMDFFCFGISNSMTALTYISPQDAAFGHWFAGFMEL